MKLVNYILIIFACFVCSTSYSQDVIHFINGEELEVKILSETKKKLEVKRFSNLYGNSLLISTSGIHKIIYEDGSIKEFNPIDQEKTKNVQLDKKSVKTNKTGGLERIEGFWRTSYRNHNEPISSYQFKDLLNESPQDMKMYKKGRGLNIIGNIVGIPSGYIMGDYISGLLLGFQYTSFGSHQGYNSKVLVAGIIGTVTSIVITRKGKSKMHQALKSYNSKALSLNFDTTDNGVGIVFTF